MEVRVTGTQFNMKAYPADFHIFVTLDEGSVLLKGMGDKVYPLKPGESAAYDCRSGKCDITRPIELDGLKLWILIFLIFFMSPL